MRRLRVARGLGITAVIGMWLVLALAGYHLAMALTLDIHHDEGWYLYASQPVCAGQHLYEDFAYFQMPLLPYVCGAIQTLAGPSVLVGRLTSVAMAVAQAVLTALIVCRLVGGWGGIVALLCLLASPDPVRVGSYTNNVILSTALGLLGCWGLVTDTSNRRWQVVAAPGWSLAVLARLSAAPALALTQAVILWRSRRRVMDAWPAVAVSAGILVVGLAPFLWPDGDQFYFNTVVAQLGRQSQFDPAPASSGNVSAAAVVVSTCLMYAPGLLICLVLGTALGWFELRRPAGVAGVGRVQPAGILPVVALVPVTYLPNLLPGDLYSTYAAASYPFACILAAWLVITAWRTWRRRALAVATSVALSCAVGAAATWQYLPTIVSWSRLGLHQLADISEYIKTSTPAAGRLVTFETTLAANTGRKVVPGAAMSYFSYFPTLTTNAARRYHVLNPTLLSEALSNARTEPVLLTDFDLHVTRCLSATLRAEPAAFSQSDLDTLLPELAGRYTLGRIIDDYGPWHNHLYILKPVQIRETRAGLP